MREYLYTLEVDKENTATSKPSELFILYAIDDIDAMQKAKRRVPGWRKVRMVLKRCEGHFMVGHSAFPPYMDSPDRPTGD